MRQRRRGHNRRVLDAHVVVRFIALLQSAQNRDRIFNVRLAHVDNLESPLQRRVLLDVFAILIQRSCANGPQLATRQGRLEHVAGIDGALGSARAHNRVQLIDKKHYLAVRFLNLFQHRLEPVLELAAIFRASQHRAQVQ